ncbi:MAG: hypothetical protein MI919_07290 [Holophagales bacterium]|nr:hypothetical protein [Holophagales bacterium]
MAPSRARAFFSPGTIPSLGSAVLLLVLLASPAAATTYYVSSETGNDANPGTSAAAPLRTLAAVNALALAPGDEVRLFCGQSWVADPLVITRSGSSGARIVYRSHPAGCADKPILRGDHPISGWSLHQGQIYVADLDLGANAGRFPDGVNQLFDAGGRLPLGRWPNLDAPDGGWATIDSQPSATRIVDASRPGGDWTGAVAHIKGIRWYILNREVTASPGSALDLGDDAVCWGGCAGWGYYLHDHLLALDRAGEWHYEPATNRVFLVSTSGPPAPGAITGSAVLPGDGTQWGLVVLGRNLQDHIAWVTVQNLRLERGSDAGVTTPINLEADENHDLLLQDLDIVDMATTGIRLRTWVWDAAANGNGPNGWRGGRNLTVRRNLVVGPNHFGLDSFATFSTFEDNAIRDVIPPEFVLGRKPRKLSSFEGMNEFEAPGS